MSHSPELQMQTLSSSTSSGTGQVNSIIPLIMFMAQSDNPHLLVYLIYCLTLLYRSAVDLSILIGQNVTVIVLIVLF